LRRAVNYGYQQGFEAGAADREDRWNYNYRNCYAYQDANFGYDGYYEDQAAYNHYFREGSATATKMDITAAISTELTMTDSTVFWVRC
jgi:hypothetical protein